LLFFFSTNLFYDMPDRVDVTSHAVPADLRCVKRPTVQHGYMHHILPRDRTVLFEHELSTFSLPSSSISPSRTTYNPHVSVYPRSTILPPRATPRFPTGPRPSHRPQVRRAARLFGRALDLNDVPLRIHRAGAPEHPADRACVHLDHRRQLRALSADAVASADQRSHTEPEHEPEHDTHPRPPTDPTHLHPRLHPQSRPRPHPRASLGSNPHPKPQPRPQQHNPPHSPRPARREPALADVRLRHRAERYPGRLQHTPHTAHTAHGPYYAVQSPVQLAPYEPRRRCPSSCKRPRAAGDISRRPGVAAARRRRRPRGASRRVCRGAGRRGVVPVAAQATQAMQAAGRRAR
jgi:hypothetical protein